VIGRCTERYWQHVSAGQKLQHTETSGGSPRGRGATMVVAPVTIGGLDPSTASFSRTSLPEAHCSLRSDVVAALAQALTASEPIGGGGLTNQFPTKNRWSTPSQDTPETDNRIPGHSWARLVGVRHFSLVQRLEPAF